MTDSPNMWQRWESYRPSKATWFWSCVACVIATLIVGFTAGGWMTATGAAQMADAAADGARDKLVAAICVNRFESSADASAQLAMLKKAATWDRDYFIQKGGWVTVPGTKEPVTGAADLCVKQLLTAAVPPATAPGGSS
jgi:hypothetical protein